MTFYESKSKAFIDSFRHLWTNLADFMGFKLVENNNILIFNWFFLHFAYYLEQNCSFFFYNRRYLGQKVRITWI